MKSIGTLRLLLAGTNVVLVALLVLEARSVFFTRHEPHLPALAVRDLGIRGKPPEALAQYETIWKELDRPPPPEPAPPGPPPPRLSPVAELYRAVVNVEDTAQPGDRIFVFQRVGAADQLVLRAGESESGLTCVSIERQGRDLVATVKADSGATGELRVHRAEDEATR